MIVWAETALSDPDVGGLEHWVAPADRTHAARYRQGPQRDHSLMARALVRALLARLTGVATWQLIADENGKPFAVDAAGARGPAISMSHSHGRVAAAAGDAAALGIDIEMCRMRAFDALAARFFGGAETDFVARTGIVGFYKIWTLREAISKADGAGLRVAANGAPLIDDPQCDGVWQQPGWLLMHAQTGTFSLAVAARGAVGESCDRLRLESLAHMG